MKSINKGWITYLHIPNSILFYFAHMSCVHTKDANYKHLQKRLLQAIYMKLFYIFFYLLKIP